MRSLALSDSLCAVLSLVPAADRDARCCSVGLSIGSHTFRCSVGPQVTGPAEGKATGCEAGETHPCWAAAQACSSCTPPAPHHTFVELGKAATFAACMKLGEEGWGDWPSSSGPKPDRGCVMVGWGDDAATIGIPLYMNELCYCSVSDYELTKAGELPVGPHGPTQEGQMAARCDATPGWTIVVGILLITGLYVGGGLFASARQKGLGIGQVKLHDHPHHGRWVDFGGLVADGVKATQSRLRGEGAAAAGAGGSLAASARSGGDGASSYGSTTGSSTTKGKSAKKPKKKSSTVGDDNAAAAAAAAAGDDDEEREDERAALVDVGGDGVGDGAATVGDGTQAGDGGRWVRVSE
eukprot:COSAG06_NODE_6146_length_3087_cov_1.980254_2_plen_352_part_00